MITLGRSRLWVVLSVLTAITFVSPLHARAARVDIDDPTLLGSLLHREFVWDANQYERAVAEVRYANGVYSYIYAVSDTPYVPGTACCEAHMVSFGLTGHPLEDTWGAINGTDAFWMPLPGVPTETKRVASITPLHDGFLVIPEPQTNRFTVVYMQSALPPGRHGRLTYTGQVRDHDHGGILLTSSFHRDGVLAPVPEPASLILFGTGLAALVARQRARRRRHGDGR
jgi:hypothetical protein